MIQRLRGLLRQAVLRVLPGRKPDFLVLGAQKCGTSTLHHLLNQHPEILGSAPKEIHCFDRWADAGRDLRWYEAHFKSADLRIRKRFESTPNYIYYEHIAERLARYQPELRFALVLRNPVERAFSAWNMYRDMFQKGEGQRLRRNGDPSNPGGIYLHFVQDRAEFPSFHESLEIERRLMREGGGPEPALLRRGLYARQLERYQRHFPPDRFLVLGFKELTQDPFRALGRLWRHIGVREIDASRLRLDPKNARPYDTELDSDARAFLDEFFRDENEKLREILGRRLDW